MSSHCTFCIITVLTGCMALHGVSCKETFMPYSSIRTVDGVGYGKPDDSNRVLSSQPNLYDLSSYERKDPTDRHPYTIIVVNDQPGRSNDWIINHLQRSSGGGRVYQGPGLTRQSHRPYRTDGSSVMRSQNDDDDAYQTSQDDQDEIYKAGLATGLRRRLLKRVAFSPWGGKRNDGMDQVDGAQRGEFVPRSFNSWGGRKRSSNVMDMYSDGL